MKSLMSFLLGIVLTIVGAVVFLSNVRVSNFTFFYRYHGTNVTALLLLLLCILLVVFIVYPGFVTGLLLGIDFLAMIVTIIMSLNFYITYMSAFEIIVILALFFGGIGLTLRGIVHAKDEVDNNKY